MVPIYVVALKLKMSDHEINFGILLGTIVLVLLALGPSLKALAGMVRRWHKGKAMEPTTPSQSWPQLLFNIVVTLMFVVVAWRLSSSLGGFYPGWPDAIRCDSQLPDQTSDRKSPLIYTFNGLRYTRRYIGDVAGYSIAGSDNVPGIGYSPHEIWFSVVTRKMIMPDQLSAAGSLDQVEEFYVRWFPKAYCGGTDIDAIIKAGRAFVFARPD